MARAPAQAETADAASVRAFYDEFSSSRMQSYLLETNLRIEKAIERVLPFVAADSRVLEIGCGLGLITERMAQVAVRGGIWACDLSEKNVESAKQRLCGENVHFRTADVLREFDELRAWIAQPVDLVVMVDVLEHLPIGTHPAVFRNLRSVMGERATLVITYPSPQYQQYLR
ncbi:MAG: putative methyltransferase, partial [Ramlibacter sp.]|nr:putative methyltransferase [Ramlibacter sp.]